MAGSPAVCGEAYTVGTIDKTKIEMWRQLPVALEWTLSGAETLRPGVSGIRIPKVHRIAQTCLTLEAAACTIPPKLRRIGITGFNERAE